MVKNKKFIQKKPKPRDKRISTDKLLPATPSSALMPSSYILPPFDMKMLEFLENYSLTFSDFSQAVANLQFTPTLLPRIDIEFYPNTSDKQKEVLAMQVGEVFDDFWERIYPSSGAGLGLDVIGQIARGGAASVEWVLNKEENKVNRAVLVPIDDIRFKSRTDGSYYPIQWIPMKELGKPGNSKAKETPGELSLDYPTYKYVPLETVGGSPYGMPPFISILKKLQTQDNIMENIDDITKKLGLLGFVSVMADAPPKTPGESESAYSTRLQTNADDWAKRFNDNMSKGMVFGYRDLMEMNYNAVAGDARGVQQVVQVLEEQIISGFKQDPAMFGRTYSTTETYAGVVYDKFINMLEHYMTIVSTVMKTGIMMQLRFSAIRVKNLGIVYEPPKSLTAKVDAEAERIRCETTILKRDNGIIDQVQAAREMGYDRPAAAGPIVPDESSDSSGNDSAKTTSNNVSFEFSKEKRRWVWS